ncbi:MAG: peptidoglycan DD-metalloendopeptidase family protein [Hyphomicrobiales bacterium]|nr:peptidoglycan DD-metalloendopeptidase family protein [Hyphomicrobiales bacterium]
MRISRSTLFHGARLGLLAGVLVVTAARAQTPLPDQGQIDQKRSELRSLNDAVTKSAATTRQIKAQIEATRADRARLEAALLTTSTRLRDQAAASLADGIKLGKLQKSEAALRQKLAGERDVMAQVLAALQRMGRNPPPAVLVRPGDMLAAIRSSILLGAVLPELNTRARALAHDLHDLLAVEARVKGEQQKLDNDQKTLVAGQKQLDALIATRQAAEAQSQQNLAAETARAAALAAKANSLADLITSMQARLSAATDARANDARLASANAAAAARVAAAAAAPGADPARLAPTATFVSTKGTLLLPADGIFTRRFGEDDGYGGKSTGDSLRVAPGADVFAPVDGWVVFAGRYRAYGNMVILNAGQGYFLLLAGMASVNVSANQFLLRGEPLGRMGAAGTQQAATLALGGAGAILYIELRKDHVPIDPDPWWAKTAVAKAGG